MRGQRAARGWPRAARPSGSTRGAPPGPDGLRREASAARGAGPTATYWLGGRRTAAAALRSGRALRLAVAAGTHGMEALEAGAATRGVPLARLPGEELVALAGEEAQGCAALVPRLSGVLLEDLLADDGRRSPDGARLLLACDRLQDPRNLGAIARTLEAAGGRGLILPRHRAAGVTPAAERAAAGAFESLPWAEVHNLPQALGMCRRAGFWIYGAAPEGDPVRQGVDWANRSVLVVGAEGRGLAPLVRRGCDRLVALPMRGAVESLNASVAAGILLYDWVRWDAARRVPMH